MTFNVPINCEEFFIFVMPTQDKHSSRMRSVGQINSLAYKLTKSQQLPNTSTHQLTTSKHTNS